MRFTVDENSSAGRVNDIVDGAGISYEFAPKTGILKILDQAQGHNLLHIECKGFLEDHIQSYIDYLEKAMQIHALLLSGNTTNQIVDVIAIEKLPSLLHHTAGVARDAYALQLNKFEEFSTTLRRDYGLKCAYIKYIQGSSFVMENEYEGHFKGIVKTHHDEQAAVRSCVLHNLLRNMADTIMLDLVSKAYSNNHRDEADLLMKLSSRLETMSRILNESYIPEAQIRTIKPSLKKIS